MNTSPVTAFLSQLRQAQILEEAQLAEADRLGQTATRPADVAGVLIKRGWLTPYQANQIARGRGGELLLASYVILEPLATGGMGQVVKARHRYMGRTVALKFIRHDQRESADSVQRFQREVRLLAELRHAHIVHAYDAGNVDAVWFLAMELLDGIDLDRLVRRHGPLPVGQACDFIRQAALGLAHAHERGLVHRDIKPSNLFLTAEGIKLLDLGLARPQAVGDEKQPGDLTRANTVMGTPDYLAPEQALDPRRADARSDLYSLGCTLYALLTGRPPFPEGTLAQKLLYHQTAEPPAVEALRAEVPAALAALVRRLLAKAPAQRPASAAALTAELGPLAAPGPDWLADAGRSKSTSVPASSLAGAKTDAPERGFTLTTESLSPASPASLLSARASAPERGWTLATESVPPTVAPSLIDAQRPAPERGFTLVA
jgi:serine/threonine-protein kinase